jgi:hypothetical protein
MRSWRLGASIVLGIAALAPVAGPADARAPSLAQLPVAAMATVPAAEYATASVLAERGGTPVEVALAVAGPFEGSAQHVIQVNQGAEAPTASRVTVLRDGLLDDSIRGERWEVLLKRTSAGSWAISEVKRAWRCRRGAQPDRFATVRCP